jgi:hypothetical protein
VNTADHLTAGAADEAITMLDAGSRLVHLLMDGSSP